MWLLDVADLSSSMLQNVMCQQMHTICYAICVGAEACQEYKYRLQTHTQKEGDQDLRGSVRCLRRRAEEREIY